MITRALSVHPNMRIRHLILDSLRQYGETMFASEPTALGYATMDSLTERLEETTATIAESCDVLERGGFIEKVGESDASNPVYAITQRGLAYLRGLSSKPAQASVRQLLESAAD